MTYVTYRLNQGGVVAFIHRNYSEYELNMALIGHLKLHKALRIFFVKGSICMNSKLRKSNYCHGLIHVFNLARLNLRTDFFKSPTLNRI